MEIEFGVGQAIMCEWCLFVVRCSGKVLSSRVSGLRGRADSDRDHNLWHGGVARAAWDHPARLAMREATRLAEVQDNVQADDEDRYNNLGAVAVLRGPAWDDPEWLQFAAVRSCPPADASMPATPPAWRAWECSARLHFAALQGPGV